MSYCMYFCLQRLFALNPNKLALAQVWGNDTGIMPIPETVNCLILVALVEMITISLTILLVYHFAEISGVSTVTMNHNLFVFHC